MCKSESVKLEQKGPSKLKDLRTIALKYVKYSKGRVGVQRTLGGEIGKERGPN